MQTRKDWMKKYYTEEQLADLRKRWSPEVQAESERGWRPWLGTPKLRLLAAKALAARPVKNSPPGAGSCCNLLEAIRR